MLVEPDCFKLKEKTNAQGENLGVKSQVDYWITIKALFMKHFPQQIKSGKGDIVNSYEHLMTLQNTTIPKLKDELENYQNNFENIFWLARSLHDMQTYVQLKTNINNIKDTQSKLDKALREYQTIIDDDPLVITYSKYLSCLYRAMTILCKLVDEPVYTWKMFLKVIDWVIAKKKREQSKREKEDSDEGESDDPDKQTDRHLKEYKQKLGMEEVKVECDFDFLYSSIIPSIYAVMCAGYSSENVSLLNLLYSLEIANIRGNVTRIELEFFIETFCKFKNYKEWRKPETSFLRITDKSNQSELIRLKRNLIKIYPKRKELFEEVNEDELEEPKLMEDINLRFIRPDDEFRSKICQLVYEELLAIFDFSEEPVKLHSFIKTASWPYPIAVKSYESINIVNTICSIASFYGVGLEVIRADAINPLVTDLNYRANQAINSNMKIQPEYEAKSKTQARKKLKQVSPTEPAILETKPPQSFSMKYKSAEEEEEYKTKGIEAALNIIEK